jgi:hypothetical protein
MRASIRFHIESRTRRLVHGIHIDMRFPLSSLSALLQQSRDNVIVFEHFGGFQVFIWFLCPSSWLKSSEVAPELGCPPDVAEVISSSAAELRWRLSAADSEHF